MNLVTLTDRVSKVLMVAAAVWAFALVFLVLGDIVGRAFSYDNVVDAVETIVDTYVDIRQAGARFNQTYRRVGLGPFKEKLYAAH